MTLRLYSYNKKKLKYGTLKKLDQYKYMYNLLIQVQLTDTLCSITVLSPDPLNTR